MISTADFKKGVRVLLEGDPYTIMDTRSQTPSARGAATLVKIKVRNLRTDQVLDMTFKSGERFHQPDLDNRGLQYLYQEGDDLVFMDLDSYEQVYVRREDIEEQAAYLSENMELKGLFFEGKLLDLDLPAMVELTIVECDPGARGDTAHGNVTKRAVLDNGLEVQVPLFIENGERIRVSTKDGKFAERAK